MSILKSHEESAFLLKLISGISSMDSAEKVKLKIII